jgi:hypothetical protein
LQFPELFEFLGRLIDQEIGVLSTALYIAHGASVRGGRGSENKTAQD